MISFRTKSAVLSVLLIFLFLSPAAAASLAITDFYGQSVEFITDDPLYSGKILVTYDGSDTYAFCVDHQVGIGWDAYDSDNLGLPQEYLGAAWLLDTFGTPAGSFDSDSDRDFYFAALQVAVWNSISGMELSEPSDGNMATEVQGFLDALSAAGSLDSMGLENRFTLVRPYLSGDGTPVLQQDLIVAHETPVPIPQPAWLLAFGLIGLLALRRNPKRPR